jgi:small subunit ribosomal protein S21
VALPGAGPVAKAQTGIDRCLAAGGDYAYISPANSCCSRVFRPGIGELTAGDSSKHFQVRVTSVVTFRELCVVRLRLRENESVQEAVRRFRKLVEHSGVKKEMRRREFYEKPSEIGRRERRRAERRARANQMYNK